MKVQIEENLFIESNPYGFEVKRYGTRYDEKAEEEVDVVLDTKHFQTIQGCCRYIALLKVKDMPADTLRDLVQAVERLAAAIEEKVAV